MDREPYDVSALHCAHRDRRPMAQRTPGDNPSGFLFVVLKRRAGWTLRMTQLQTFDECDAAHTLPSFQAEQHTLVPDSPSETGTPKLKMGVRYECFVQG
jgi:hypothetical protein